MGGVTALSICVVSGLSAVVALAVVSDEKGLGGTWWGGGGCLR